MNAIGDNVCRDACHGCFLFLTSDSSKRGVRSHKLTGTSYVNVKVP